MENKEYINSIQPPMLPTVLDGFLQPGFPLAKVFTCFFLNDCLVFVKTGSFGTNMSDTMRASLGGYTSTGLIAGAIGGVVDVFTADSRIKNATQVAGYSRENMVAAHKRNFMLPYQQITLIEIKGPNFAGELKVIFHSEKIHKFRINRQSKASANYIEQVFLKFLPGKIQKK